MPTINDLKQLEESIYQLAEKAKSLKNTHPELNSLAFFGDLKGKGNLHAEGKQLYFLVDLKDPDNISLVVRTLWTLKECDLIQIEAKDQLEMSDGGKDLIGFPLNLDNLYKEINKKMETSKEFKELCGDLALKIMLPEEEEMSPPHLPTQPLDFQHGYEGEEFGHSPEFDNFDKRQVITTAIESLPTSKKVEQGFEEEMSPSQTQTEPLDFQHGYEGEGFVHSPGFDDFDVRQVLTTTVESLPTSVKTITPRENLPPSYLTWLAVMVNSTEVEPLSHLKKYGKMQVYKSGGEERLYFQAQDTKGDSASPRNLSASIGNAETILINGLNLTQKEFRINNPKLADRINKSFSENKLAEAQFFVMSSDALATLDEKVGATQKLAETLNQAPKAQFLQKLQKLGSWKCNIQKDTWGIGTQNVSLSFVPNTLTDSKKSAEEALKEFTSIASSTRKSTLPKLDNTIKIDKNKIGALAKAAGMNLELSSVKSIIKTQRANSSSNPQVLDNLSLKRSSSDPTPMRPSNPPPSPQSGSGRRPSTARPSSVAKSKVTSPLSKRTLLIKNSPHAPIIDTEMRAPEPPKKTGNKVNKGPGKN